MTREKNYPWRMHKRDLVRILIPGEIVTYRLDDQKWLFWAGIGSEPARLERNLPERNILEWGKPANFRFEGNLQSGPSSLGVPGVPWHTQILADQLTLFQPGGTDYAHLITTGTPGFSDTCSDIVWYELKLWGQLANPK